MEPLRRTAIELLAIEQELMAREPIFHREEQGSTRAALEAMTDADFWETGASGRRYSRAFVIDTVLRRRSNPSDDEWKTAGFHCQEIAVDNYLLTYTLWQGQRVTQRATLWRRSSEGWKIVYHQGTVVETA